MKLEKYINDKVKIALNMLAESNSISADERMLRILFKEIERDCRHKYCEILYNTINEIQNNQEL